MHLLLSVLSLSLLLLHLPDHEVESLSVPVILLFLPPPSLLIARHLSPELLPDLRAALLRLLTPEEPPVAHHGHSTRRLVILSQGHHAVVVVQGEACRESALHRVVQGFGDLAALPVLQDLPVEGGFVRDHSLTLQFFSQFILLLDGLHHVGKVLTLFKLGRTQFFEFLVRTGLGKPYGF